MKIVTRNTLLFCMVFCKCLNVYAQELGDSTKNTTSSVKLASAKTAIANGKADTTIDFERPLNFFASAGISYRLYGLYNVAVSPIDNTVQIETANRLNSRISFGLVWNPFKDVRNVIPAINFKHALGVLAKLCQRGLVEAMRFNSFLKDNR